MCGNGEKQTFHRNICRLVLDRQRANGIVPCYTTCDPCAALVAIEPNLSVLGVVQRRCSVVRDEIDKRGLVVCESERNSLAPNVSIVTRLNFELLQQYLVRMLL
jgi:inosine-uridine nucleoside N-ribohydrolase